MKLKRVSGDRILAMTLVILSVHEVETVLALQLCHFPAIYNFGDSNSDTGGISAAFYPAGPPSGETYFHRPAGRASDGRLIIDFIGTYLFLEHVLIFPVSLTLVLETLHCPRINSVSSGETIFDVYKFDDVLI